mmetsp:Transcript_40345/g.93780  ORF Transcript_40345/g.93780 Transcript_40345/m.93780 type:complete len:179 (+) Transcript_40345:18-554(+)
MASKVEPLNLSALSELRSVSSASTRRPSEIAQLRWPQRHPNPQQRVRPASAPSRSSSSLSASSSSTDHRFLREELVASRPARNYGRYCTDISLLDGVSSCSRTSFDSCSETPSRIRQRIRRSGDLRQHLDSSQVGLVLGQRPLRRSSSSCSTVTSSAAESSLDLGIGLRKQRSVGVWV